MTGAPSLRETPVSPPPSVPARPLPLALAAIAVLVAFLGFHLRATAAWQAAHVAPGASITSGYEEETLFALARATHGQPVYLDPLAIPYASAYFNWLFYSTYAAPLRLAVAAEGDSAIPLVGRLITALGALSGAALLWWVLARILPHQRLFAAALATFAFAGPLVSWWAHTVRPDVWAMTFEAAALATLLAAHRCRPARALAGACLLFYAAWAFKPTFVTGLGAAVLFLLSLRRWRDACLLVAGFAALVLLTLLLGTEQYRACLSDTAGTNRYYLASGLDQLRSAALKLAPLALLLLAAFIRRSPAPAPGALASDALRLGMIGIVVTVPLAFVASCKMGAAPNYFFPAAPVLALAAAGLHALRPAPALQLLALVAMIALQIAPLTGRFGRIDLTPQAESLAARWSVLRHLPEPRFCQDQRLNLPHLNPHSPPFVLAFNYPLNRAAGKNFERGGIGGLIEAGYFRALLLPPTTEFDGGSLRRYVPTKTVDGLTAYVRDDLAPSTR